MKIGKYSLALLLVMAGCTAQPAVSPSTEPTVETGNLTQTAEQLANVLVTQLGATSVQYALMDNGEVTVSGQAGVFAKESDQALSAQDQYAIGSVSKMFTAAAVMKLQDEGKLDLDQPVAELLPEFTMADERYSEITVRMLLNHSSGLPGSSFSEGFMFVPDTTAHDTFLENLKTLHLQADPGAYSVYSNDSFVLAELVVEKVSGQDFTSYLRTQFIEPLGMTRTQTSVGNVDFNAMPKVYSATQPQRTLPADIVSVIGTGGIYSTAEDLCRWGLAFMPSSSMLSAEALSAMSVNEAKKGIWPTEQANSIGYGLGWDSVELSPFAQAGIQALSKGGDTMYSHTAFVVLPQQGLTCAVLSSGGLSSYNQMMASTLLEQALMEKGVISEALPHYQLPTTPETVPAIPEEVQAYAGLYADSTSLYRIDFTEEGILNFTIEQMPDTPTPLTHVGDGQFLLPSPMTNQLFSFEENGGHTYLKVEAVTEIPGLGYSATTVYYAMKVEENPLSDAVKSAWQTRSTKTYLLISEDLHSQIYEMILPIAPVPLSSFAEGYVNAHQIVDENRAAAIVQIPGSGSRDQFDYTFFTQDGVEYLQTAGDLYASQDSAVKAEVGTMNVTLNDQGHTQWLTLDPALEGKTLTVSSDSQGVFVYDATMICLYNRVTDGEKTITLPSGGTLGLAGEAGAVFTLTIE